MEKQQNGPSSRFVCVCVCGWVHVRMRAHVCEPQLFRGWLLADPLGENESGGRCWRKVPCDQTGGGGQSWTIANLFFFLQY